MPVKWSTVSCYPSLIPVWCLGHRTTQQPSQAQIEMRDAIHPDEHHLAYDQHSSEMAASSKVDDSRIPPPDVEVASVIR